MGQNENTGKPSSAAEKRKERLAQELRANLQRRKSQSRARRQGDEDRTFGLPAAGGQKPG